MNEVPNADCFVGSSLLENVDPRCKLVFDAVNDGIFIADPVTGRFIEVNAPGCEMFGYKKAEILAADIGTLSSGVHPYTLGMAIHKHMALSMGDRQLFEWHCRTKSGSLFWADVSVHYTELDLIPAIVAIVRDITERKRIEQMKSEFVSTVSHELRTPLTSIAGSLALLAQGAAGPLPDKARRLIAIGRQNSQRLVRLVNDILDIEKMESGGIVFAYKPVELGPLVGDVIKANRQQAEAGGVTIRMTGPAAGPVVRGDRDRLIQVVTNLLSNAIKFSPPGSTVAVTVHEEDDAGVVCVRDEGPGIPEWFRKRIFQRFAQADASHARQKGGTGLGLAIVKEIVERHDGCVTFECPQQGGTTFRVELPLAEEPAGAPEIGARPSPLATTAAIPPGRS